MARADPKVYSSRGVNLSGLEPTAADQCPRLGFGVPAQVGGAFKASWWGHTSEALWDGAWVRAWDGASVAQRRPPEGRASLDLSAKDDDAFCVQVFVVSLV